MKVLVTGGAGFVGSHIVDRLLREGHQVRILDNLEPRIHPKGLPAYLPGEAEFMEGDVRDKNSWKRALKNVQVIFHQAAYQDYMPDYSKFFEVNATSTALMYEVINENRGPVEKIIVASSQAVYGEGQYECKEHGFTQPPSRQLAQLDLGEWEMLCPQCRRLMEPLSLKEEYANPYNQYALSKYSQELVAIRLGRQLNIPAVALRYSITQGSRQSLYNQYSGICRIFTLRLLSGQPPIIYEDGLQARDFVHIDDVVEANMLVLGNHKADFEVFNVGSGRTTTVIQYADVLTRKLGKNIEPVVPGEYRLGDNRHSVSDISKLMELGWRPKKLLEDIFNDYIGWLESLGDVEDYFTETDRLMRQSGVIRQVDIS